MTKQHCKIVRLEAENFKRLVAVEIEPDGHTIVISGANSQGKTSLLDAIFVVLGGARATRALLKPIRDREDRAHVTIDLSNGLTATRKWKKFGNSAGSLTVTSNGVAVKSPQAVLDKLIGDLSFDPLAFAEAKPEAQREMLLGLIDVGLDLDETDKEIAKAFEERTAVNREAKALRARHDALPAPDADLPQDEIGAATLMGELQAAQNVVAAREVFEGDYARACDEVKQCEQA
ncbi:hypothetical protein LCGC14_2450420, partial [marine sediment metagenome]